MLDYKKNIKFHKEMFLEFDFFFLFNEGVGKAWRGEVRNIKPATYGAANRTPSGES